MSSMPHPFASAGGGTLFEYKVATLLTRDLILSRQTRFSGLIEAIALQSGPSGFDDLTVSLDLRHGGARVVHMQCRYRQSFAGSNSAFAELIADASAALICDGQDTSASATEDTRLAIIVDSGSPAHKSMTRLCQLARTSDGFEHFLGVVARHQGEVQQRWNHCREAAGDLGDELLHRVLAKLEVRSFSLDSDTSADSLELINQLAEAWDRPNHGGALNLANAVFRLVCDLGPSAGVVDVGVLQAELGLLLPFVPGADTRRERLRRKREGSRLRIWDSLSALGLDEDEAELLTTQVLAAPPRVEPAGPTTVVSGPMGVGKSTELERLHCAAIDAARENRNAPIPIFVTAAEIGQLPLLDSLSRRVEGLGDPSRVGVHVVIDGLDEAGVQVGALTTRIATMRSEWPKSIVLLGTRPQATSRGAKSVTVEPMTPEIAQGLMKTIDPDIVNLDGFQDELAEVLRHPLFAIRCALDHREGRGTRLDRGQLVASVGEQAIRDLGDATDEAFDLLVRLASQIVDAGGRPVDANGLGISLIQVGRLLRSRIVHAVDGQVSFHLAVLTEWFAAEALLRDPAALAHGVSSPSSAYRWRYVLVQALLQGSDDDVDKIMTALLAQAPATAAWVHHEARQLDRGRSSAPLAVDTQQAGMRIRRATEAWFGPWPSVVKPWRDGEELPTLGIAADDERLATAWHAESQGDAAHVVTLPANSDWFDDPNSPWVGIKIGRRRSGVGWHWAWTGEDVQRAIESCFEDRRLLADIELCWPELAWDFAYRMIRRISGTRSGTVMRTDLEATIAWHRSMVPEGEVFISSGFGPGWRLSDGMEFVDELATRGIAEIRSPWLLAETGDTDDEPRTIEQRLAYLELTTKAALDVYGAVVREHLPSMAPELTTFQLLPARIVGAATPFNPANVRLSPWRHRWHIEPLPPDSQNEAQWSLVDAEHFAASHDWESQMLIVRDLRGELAERVPYSIHFRDPATSRTPAGLLALRLLWKDLAEYEWVSRHDPLLGDIGSSKPRYS